MNKRRDLQVFHSLSTDVFENLALEEALLSRIERGREILFLYENAPAVVIGRFQNPWQECRTGLARREGVPVCRRISGGGTVVHGPGNLNFSVICAEKNPRKEDNLKKILQAASGLGLPLETNSHCDILLPRGPGTLAKVSGSAFRQTARGSLHHGTLLVNANLGQLKRLLHQPRRRMETRSVASVPSEVANLSSLMPGLSVAAVKKALTERWLADAGKEDYRAVEISAEWAGDDVVFQEALTRLSSREWIWEKTPAFREWFFGLPALPVAPELAECLKTAEVPETAASSEAVEFPETAAPSEAVECPQTATLSEAAEPPEMFGAGCSGCGGRPGPPAGCGLQIQVKGGKIAGLQLASSRSSRGACQGEHESAKRPGTGEGLPENHPLQKCKGLSYHGPDLMNAAGAVGAYAGWLKVLGARIDGDAPGHAGPADPVFTQPALIPPALTQ